MADSVSTNILAQRAPFSPLNLDLLLSTMEFISERSDLFSFMRTCHDLYTRGIRLLLKFPCVISPRHLPSFYNFLLSNAPSTFRALRHLNLNSFRYEPTYMRDAAYNANLETLVDILQKATTLEVLTLYGEILCEHGGLPLAIASSTNLHTLNIRGRNAEQTEFILTRLRSPLTSVHVHFHYGQDVLPLLANFCGTLQSVKLSDGDYTSAGNRWIHVTHLELAYSRPRLSLLAPAFPNITTLIMPNMDLNFEDDWETIEDLQDENIEFQETRSSPIWKLSFLSTDLAGLFALGLQFQVPRVRIEELVSSHYVPLEWLSSIMSNLRPVQLILWGFDNLYDMEDLSEMFSEGMEDLRELYISSDLPDADPNDDNPMERLLNGLAPLDQYNPGLSVLSFCIHAARPSSNSVERRDKVLMQFDTNVFARRVAERLPSVKLMRVNLKARSDSTVISQQYWESCDQGGIQEVSGGRVGMMKEYEDFDQD